jgi:hypothetical protein
MLSLHLESSVIFVVGLVVKVASRMPAHLLSVPGIDRNTRCNMRANAFGNQFGEATPSTEIGEHPGRSAGASTNPKMSSIKTSLFI